MRDFWRFRVQYALNETEAAIRDISTASIAIYSASVINWK